MPQLRHLCGPKGLAHSVLTLLRAAPHGRTDLLPKALSVTPLSPVSGFWEGTLPMLVMFGQKGSRRQWDHLRLGGDTGAPEAAR